MTDIVTAVKISLLIAALKVEIFLQASAWAQRSRERIKRLDYPRRPA